MKKLLTTLLMSFAIYQTTQTSDTQAILQAFNDPDNYKQTTLYNFNNLGYIDAHTAFADNNRIMIELNGMKYAKSTTGKVYLISSYGTIDLGYEEEDQLTNVSFDIVKNLIADGSQIFFINSYNGARLFLQTYPLKNSDGGGYLTVVGTNYAGKTNSIDSEDGLINYTSYTPVKGSFLFQDS